MKKLHRHANRRRNAFTLLEVLLVVGILVALAAIALPNLIGTQAGAQIDEARIQVRQFETAFKTYFTHNGQFPATEQAFGALMSPPQPAPKNWRGPYLELGSSVPPVDPWGSPYQYLFPGSRRPQSATSQQPDIWSNGPDRQSGTADDIGNWGT